MEELSMDKGVFVESATLDLKRMMQCLEALQAFPVSHVHSIESDDRYKGFRIALDQAEARKLLGQRVLAVHNQRAGVYPLTTFLQVHNIDVSARTERDLIDAMEKFGKVLHYEKGPPDQMDNHPTHLVLLDIPEMESLQLWQKNGYPKMSVMVPSMSKTFKVTFWCRQCRESDHGYWKCKMYCGAKGLQGETPMLSGLLSSSGPTRSSIEMFSGNVPASSSNVQEPSERFPSKFTMRSIHGLPVDHEPVKQESTNDKAKNISRIIDSLKKNKALEESSSGARTEDVDELSNRSSVLDKPDSSERSPVGDDLVKDELDEDSLLNAPFEHYEFMPPVLNATSTTDDEIQDLSETKGYSKQDVVFDHESNPGKTDIKTEPQSNGTPERGFLCSPPVTPQGNWIALQPGPSTTRQQSHFNLSDKLDGCIERAYEEFKVLDREILESFLVHVKKKSNPTRVAKNYTKNVKGLENQLRRILQNYYNQPETGTKNDSMFIKWLNGLVERFHGPVSRKRKPSSRGVGSPPPKR